MGRGGEAKRMRCERVDRIPRDREKARRMTHEPRTPRIGLRERVRRFHARVGGRGTRPRGARGSFSRFVWRRVRSSATSRPSACIVATTTLVLRALHVAHPRARSDSGAVVVAAWRSVPGLRGVARIRSGRPRDCGRARGGALRLVANRSRLLISTAVSSK